MIFAQRECPLSRLSRATLFRSIDVKSRARTSRPRDVVIGRNGAGRDSSSELPHEAEAQGCMADRCLSVPGGMYCGWAAGTQDGERMGQTFNTNYIRLPIPS